MIAACRRAWWVAGLLAAAGLWADDAATAIVSELGQSTWERYRALNQAETRLAEYRDSDDELALKLTQLSYVNASRKQYGVQPLELDILASRVANRQATEAAQNRFRGHWNMRGEKPYQRYAFAGGVDHVSENASAVWTSGAFDQSLDKALQFMRDAHDRFMAERAPNDGHKRTVIEREHTHVGLGFRLEKAYFAYYEEYVDRYLVFADPPSASRVGQQTVIAFKPAQDGLYPYAVISYYEAFPRPMTVAEVNARGSYPDYTGDQEHTIWPWELETARDGYTRVPLTFSRKGLYYIQIYLDTRRPTGRSADTRGKIQGSGLVVRVE